MSVRRVVRALGGGVQRWAVVTSNGRGSLIYPMYLLRVIRALGAVQCSHPEALTRLWGRRNGRPSGCSRSDPWAERRALAKARWLK